jgi:hypothetical protein
MARSKILNIGGDRVSFEYDKDGNILGILDHSDRTNPKPIDPTTDKFTDILRTDAAITAYNFNKFGGNKDSYTNTLSVPSIEEQTAFFNGEDKAENNTENNIEETIYPNIDDGVANPNLATQAPAFAAYKSTRTSPGTDFFTYPLDIDPMQDHLKISKYEYARNNPSTDPGVQGSRPIRVEDQKINNTSGEKLRNLGIRLNPFDNREFVRPVKLERVVEGDSMLGNQLQGSVLLPMPKVVDTNGCEWGESELNVFGLTAVTGADQGQKILGNALGGGKQIDKLEGLDIAQEDLRAVEAITARQQRGGQFRLGKGFKDFGSALANAAAAEGTARITGQSVSQDQFLARTSGRVLNPNAELLFQGPVLRDFNFDFLMIARSQKEGKEIRKIIRWFKSGMAPKFNSSTFLKTPDIFTLEYKNGVGDGDILKTVNRFSPGGLALRTIAVDYAPSGYWAAYKDSQPVAVKMSLNFAELRPIYSQDQNQDELIDTVGY